MTNHHHVPLAASASMHRSTRTLLILSALLATAPAFGCDSGSSYGSGSNDAGSDASEDAASCADQTFTVTNSGASAYVIGGRNNPTLTLCRGHTYTFQLNASGHPFWIKTVRSTGTSNPAPGVTNNGVDVGTITYVVPNDAPGTLFYDCQFHSAMSGSLLVP